MLTETQRNKDLRGSYKVQGPCVLLPEDSAEHLGKSTAQQLSCSSAQATLEPSLCLNSVRAS